jgi:hypothetical protein
MQILTERQEGKQFFFEKKNQKTFIYCARLSDAISKSFLPLFFKKEVLLSPEREGRRCHPPDPDRRAAEADYGV